MKIKEKIINNSIYGALTEISKKPVHVAFNDLTQEEVLEQFERFVIEEKSEIILRMYTLLVPVNQEKCKLLLEKYPEYFI